MLSLAVIFVAAIAAFSVSALAGGGAGLVMLPLLGLALPAAQVPAALSIGTAVSSISRLVMFRDAVRWEVVRWFVPAAMPFVFAGAWLLTHVQPHYLRLALGCFLVGNLLFALRPRRTPPCSPTRPSPASLGMLGAVAGFVSGFTGAVGVLFNDVYLRWGLSKQEIVATRAANEILLHLVKIALYATFGLLDGPTFALGGLVAVAAVLASFGAKRILAGLDEALFRRINLGAMGVAGVAMLCSAGGALATQHGLGWTGRFDAAGLEVGVRWQDRFVAIEWLDRGGPRFERSIDMAQLPPDLRSVATSFAHGADRVVVEKVRALDGVTYEIKAYREDRKTSLTI